MSSEEYTKSMRYEMLIRNAFDCQSGMKNGAHQSFMQNAMTMERGETFAKHLGTFNKQFKEVKSYTSKALLKIGKKQPHSNESDFFHNLEKEVEYVSTTNELMNIVNLAMDKLIELKK